MANWCSNCVTIDSKEDTDLYNSFSLWLDDKEDDFTQGWHPDVKGTDEHRALFSINTNDEDSFNFESKWSPAIDTMVLTARHYKFSFTLEYEESGCGLYGEYKYDYEEDSLSVRYLKNVPEWTEENDDSYYDTLESLLQKEEFNIKEINL